MIRVRKEGREVVVTFLQHFHGPAGRWKGSAQFSFAKVLIQHDFRITMSSPPIIYAFQPDEKISRGFARVLGEIAVGARDLTRGSREPLVELIHEGRLLIKRLRALLWFARPAPGLAACTRARARLRKASGLLAGQRDLAVTHATLQELAQKPSAHPRDRAAVTQIIRSLAGHSTAGEEAESMLRQTLQKAMGILRLSINEIKRHAMSRARWPSASQRLEKAFRAMRKAGKKARRTGMDADFHTWRKKAKTLFYQLELTQAESGRRMARTMKRVGKLQTALGEYHDGVVVKERLRRIMPPPVSTRRVLRLLAKRKAKLRKKARKIAHSL